MTSGALVKIAPVDPNVPRGLGMRQMLTEEAKWKELAGAACAGCSGCSEAASKPSAKPWPALPERPEPGPEPRLQTLCGREGRGAALSELSQRRKEWEAARHGLKRCEAAEAAASGDLERLFPAQPEQLSGESGYSAMGLQAASSRPDPSQAYQLRE